MSTKSIAVTFAALLAAAGFATPAHACACCTETGQRYVHTGPMDTYIRGEFENVQFAPAARLYTDEGFPDTIEGVASPSDKEHKLVVERRRKTLVFAFTDAAGRAGTVELVMPKDLTRFEVDPRSGTSEGGHGPTLYKEWRVNGLAKLTGIFAAQAKWARAELVLHGRGLGCTSSADFDAWTLVVRGKAIKFTFLGATVR
jgi:hypothetical protein